MDPGLSFSDYRLTFPEACQPHQVVFSPSLQVAPDRPDYPLEQGRYLPLRHDLFDLDAVVLADAPRQVTLSSPKGKPRRDGWISPDAVCGLLASAQNRRPLPVH